MLYKGSFAAEVTFLCRKSLIWFGRTLEMTLDFKARSRKLKSMPQPPFPLGATQADIKEKEGQAESAPPQSKGSSAHSLLGRLLAEEEEDERERERKAPLTVPDFLW